MSALAALALASCPHPYMPLSTGQTWTYRLTDGAEVTLAVQSVESGDGWQSAAVGAWLSADADDPVVTTTFACGEEGLVLPLGAAALAGRARVETLQERGVSLLPAARLTKGAEWESDRVLRVTADARSLTTALSSRHRVAGREKVKTPAGTFDALRIDVSTSALAGGAEKPRARRTTLWFARDVGLVKMQGDAELTLVRRERR